MYMRSLHTHNVHAVHERERERESYKALVYRGDV